MNRSKPIPTATRCLAVVATSVVMSGAWATSAHAATPSPITSTNCASTSVAGVYDVFQSNFPGGLPLTLTQNGATVGGTFYGGTVAGTVEGNTLHFVADFGGGLHGDYTATILPGQLTDGYTYEVGNPGNNATFTAIGNGGNGCSNPTTKDQCKNGGYSAYGNPAAAIPVFKNQGDCVSYVASRGKSDAH